MKSNEFLRANFTLKGMTRWGLSTLCTLLLFAHLSFADDFTAHHLGDYGNVTVMEVSGNYDADLPDGTFNAAPRQAIANEFFRTHKDEYDFVTIFTNFDFALPPKAVAFYGPVSNDVRGIGQNIFDNSALFGSKGKLQGTIDMGNYLKLVSNPMDPKFDFTVDTLMHETLHRWAAYVKFRDWNGTVSDALLGKDKAHWSFLLDSAGSTLYGNKWKDNGDGTFTSTAVRKYYSPLDLYVMGMIDKSKVPPTLLIDNPAINPAKMPEIGDTISGTAHYVKIDDIIAVQDQGERVPNAKDSQKQFKTAFIYAVSPGTFNFDDLYGIENIRNGFLPRYSILTDGKSLVQVASTVKDDLPANPGVRPPSSTPRTLPPSIDNGVTWLTSHQQTDGSWTDYSLTTERDTAEAVTTLQRFPIAAQSFQAGFAWLGNNAAANTDFLARRIEASVQAGNDSSALVQELISRRNHDGGWGSNRGFISTPTDTALVLKALAVAGYSDSTVTGPAIAYLQGTQNPDGGWSGDDAFSTIQPTSAVLTAFNSYRKSIALDANITRAVAFITSKQNPDGGFGNSPSTIYDSALAVIALQTVGMDKTKSDLGASYLQGQQSEDGSWFASPYQTALAVRAVWAATVTPDLSVNPEDLMIIPAKVTSLPTNVVLSVNVSNLGRTDILQAKVAIYDGGVTADKKVSEQSAAFPGLSPVKLTFSIPITDNRQHLFYVVTDPDNQVNESSKSNNTAAISLTPDITYDFKVASSDVTATPNPVDIGKDLKISVKITSASSTDAFNVPIRIFINQIGAPFEIAALTADIPAGGSVVKETVWKATHAGADMPLTVQIDPNNTYTEISKDNNSASIPLTASYPVLNYDFSVAASDIAVTPNQVDMGKDVKISLKISNSGTSDAYSVPIRLFIDQAGSQLEIATLTADIPAGGSVVKETVWKASRAGVNMPLTVQIDPNNTFTEISKNNNSASMSLTVNASTLPNLSVSYKDMVITPSPAREGGNASISVLVKNDGFSSAENVKVNVYLGVASNGGVLLGSQVIPVIPVGQSARTSVDWSGIAVNGGQLISVQVAPDDPDNTIQEITKDDNFTFMDLDVLSLPDLAISTSSITINPAMPNSQDKTITVAVTVQNGGDQEARDVPVQLKEGGAVIGSTVIPLVNGNSQATGTIGYINAGQIATHQITVTVAPDSTPGNMIVERTKDNNSAVKTFSIQDANLWLTETYISPDGDGIKDITDFSFRLAAPTQVSVQVVNKKGVAVRTVSGGELDNTAGSTVTWDGKNDAGSVVSDGTYKIQVVATNGKVLASLPIEVDTNRSPLADALGTKYLLQNNQTCMLPPYDRMTWLPNESGLAFQLYPAQDSPYLDGLYAMAPTGEDILRLIPGLWNSTTNPNARYTVEKWEMSQNGQRIAFLLRDSSKPLLSLWIVDTDGNNLTKAYDFSESYIEKIAWAPDGRRIAISHYSGLYMLNPETMEMKHVSQDGSQKEWADDSSLIYSISTWPAVIHLVDVNGLASHYSIEQFGTINDGDEVKSAGWVWGKKVPLYVNAQNPVLLFDAKDGTFSPLAFSPLAGVGTSFPTISPDKRFVAWADAQQCGDCESTIEQISVMDSARNVTVIARSETNPEAPTGAKTGIGSEYVWSKDGSAIAYINTRYNSLDSTLSDELVIHDVERGTDQRVEVRNYTCENYAPSAMAKAAVYSNMSGNYCYSPKKISRIVAWMKDKINFLLETSEGIFSFNSDDQTSSDYLPLDGSNFLSFSPNERYLTYEKYNDSNSGCFPKWQNQWAMSSLLNLTADLRISKLKTYVTLRGIASDKNFDGYRLEYADIKTPGTWNLISPPSDVPVLNNIFTSWVPPYEGSFLVRLTAWDKAGNQAVDRKRLNWGMSSLITNLYKTEEYISPNGDGNKETVELHYQVLEPVHLEFNIYDSSNNLVMAFSRDHTDPVSDFIRWDGTNRAGNVVPDGQYRISVFDYDFFVTVDSTLPGVAIGFGKFAWTKNDAGWPVAVLNVLGRAFDANMKKWEIESGIGDNPQTWVAQSNGREPMVSLDSQGNPHNVLLRGYVNEQIGTLKGARFRITAEDYAGNQSRMLSDFVEEKLELLSWNDKAISLVLNSEGLLPPSKISNLINVVSGIETYRFKTVRRFLQYQSGGKWMDGVVQDVNDMDGYFSFEWDTSALNTDLITALRIKVVDEFGGVYYRVIGIDRDFILFNACETNLVDVYYELADELDTLLLQFSYDKGKTWKDIRTTKNRSASIECGHDVPLYDPTQKDNYSVRAIATTKDGVVRTETLRMSSKKCNGAGIKFDIEVAYDEATICNTLAPGKATVAVSAIGGGTAILDSLKLSMKAPDGDRLLKDFGESGGGSVVVDTSAFSDGTYPVTATLAYTFIFDETVQHGVMTKNASILVSHTLPHVKLTYPSEDTGQAICPVRIKYSDAIYKYGVNVAGVTTSIVGIGHYELAWGNGASPGSWGGALRGFPSDLDPYIYGTGAVNGKIDTWDVTGFKGDTYSLQLRATDTVGNKGCTTSTFYLNEPIRIASIAPSRQLISSINGYSVDAGYQLTGPATIGIKVFPVVNGPPETLGEPALRSIASDVHYLSGVDYTYWDGTRDGGAILPDGKYGLTVTSLDACQLPDIKWASIEIDNTPPAAAIGYPRPNDPLPTGNIFEVKGTATDQHFMSYLLEAGEGSDPSNWVLIKGGTRSMSNEKIAAWNTFGLKDIWTLRLTTFDMAGNTNVATSTINLGVRKDLIKLFVVAPDLISPNNDQKRDATHISYEVTDACQIKFEVLNGGGSTVKTIVITTSAAGTGSFDWDGKSATNDVVADGVYTVRMYASLTGKPEVNQTETLTLTVDKVAPQAIIPVPADKAYYNKTDMPVIGSITDQNPDSYTLTVTGPAGTSILDSGNQNRTGYTFGTITDLTEDTYTLTATANDLGENQSKTVRTFTIDRTPPKVTLDTPKNGEFYGNTKNAVDISGSIIEKNLDRYSLRYGTGETPADWTEVVGGGAVPTASKLSSLKVGKSDGLADGLYTLSLYAKDKAGLEGEARAKIVIDNTPPQVAITVPKIGDYVTKAFDIKGTVADTYFDTGIIELAEGSCATAVKWAVTKTLSAPVQDNILDSWKVLPTDGEYCIKLSAIDKSGNKSETKTGIRIDTHPPVAPQLTGKTDNKVDAVLSWTKNIETDLAGYNLYRNSQKVNTSLLTDITYRDPALKEGTYAYSVKAVDFAGNESGPSNVVSLKIDLSGPSVRISTPGNATTVSNLIDIKGTAYSQDDFKEYRVSIGLGSSPSSWTLIRRSPLPISFGSLAQWDTITSQEGAQFTIKLEGEDISGNISTTQAIVAIDNTPPNAPVLDLPIPPPGSDVALTWKANTETDLAGYLLYRNDQLANVTGIVAGNLKPYLVTGTSFTDKALPDGTYNYYLEAMDQAGNTSPQSNHQEVTIDTHPPHMTITAPVNGQKFDGKLTIKAETPDNDIATVQFQYKRPQDASWTNLGSQFVKAPYFTYLDPKALSLTFGDYQIQALATDQHNKIDPSPTIVTVTYADLTPPDVPSGLAAKVNGANVNLTWNAVSEAGAGYNIYRWNAATRSKVNSVPTKNASYLDAGVADGTYQYEITAIDVAGNESTASGQATAKIYAPVIAQPYTPLKNPALILEGNGVDPGTQVQITTVHPSGDPSTVTVTADSSGAFRMEGITLALGENRFTAIATDSAGNISRSSETVVVVYGASPAVPTGLAASVNNYDVNLTWNANSEANIIGYNLFRDGEKVNAAVALTGGQASASSQDSAPQNAIDGNYSTYWSTPYSYGTFTPAWWQMSLAAPELISRLDITWQLGDWDYDNNKYIILAGKDYEVQGWSGYNWVTLKKVSGNDRQYNTIDISPSYRTDRIRIAIASTTDPNYSKYVRIREIKFTKENPVPSPPFTDPGLIDFRYTYTVTAVNQYGFESGPSVPAGADVGDLVPPGPPQNLSAAAQGSDVALSWNPPVPSASDLSQYYVYLQTSSGWSQLSAIPASMTAITLPGFSNGTYHFRVTAVDLTGNESIPSNEAEATINIATLKAPVLAISTPVTGGALDLTWQEPSGAVPDSYNVYRSQNEAGSFSLVNITAITGTGFHDTGLINGATYYYRVRAVDEIGNEGEPSNTVSGVPQDMLSIQPLILKPTMAGTPLVVRQNGITVGGFAEPGAQVAVLRDGAMLGSAGASTQDVQADTALDLNVYNAALSPDGQILATVDYSSQLQLRNLKSGEVTSLSVNGLSGFSLNTLQWSPDGRYLLVSVYDTSSMPSKEKAALYDADLAQVRLLTTGETQTEWGASWVSAGGTIVFAGMDGSGQNGIWKAQAGNSGATLLANTNIKPEYLRMSADGNHIAFFDYNNKLYQLSPSDGSIELLDDNTDGRTLAWSPDGSKLVYVSGRDGGDGELYQMNVADGAVSRLTFGDLGSHYAVWSPDGKQLAYLTWNASGEVAHIAPLDSAEREISTSQSQMYGMEWRQNGELLYLNKSGIHTISPAGTFSLSNAQLIAGENRIVAVSTDSSGNISDPSEAVTVTLDTGEWPDLAITASDITFFPPYPKPGEDVLVTARVHNPTVNAVDNATVELYLWDGSNDVTLLKSDVIQHLDANGDGSVSVRFNAGTAMGTRTVIAVADPSNLIPEVLETNNYASRDLVVTDKEQVSVSTSLSSLQYGVNQDATIGVNLMNSGTATTGTLKVMIEDSDGNLVKLLASQARDLPYGLDQKLAFTWNTGATYAGSYKVHALVTDSAGISTLAENATLFSILPDLQATGTVTTDKQSYGSVEPVNLGITFKNSGVNYVIPQLKVRVRIIDALNTQLFSEEKIFTNLLPSTGGSLISTWNTGLSPAGAYTAVVDLSAGDQVLASKSAAFTILARPLLKGTLSVDTATVLTGRSFNSTYTVSNQGNSAAVGTVRVTLQDPDSLAIVTSFEQPANIAVNGSMPGTATFDTTGLALKTYQVVLCYKADTTWQNIAMTTIRIKDGIAPTISIISPQVGVSYTKEVSLSVFATDDSSGVALVEYNIDNGAWKQMPLADPSTGRYSIALTLTPMDNGGHTAFFRGTDRAGNVSLPVSINYVVQSDTIPPVLNVSALPDGSYTNSDVLNITGIVTDNVGVKELLINGTPVSVQSDGSFSQALVLVDGANTIAVIATDQANNQANDIRIITLDRKAPLIDVISPADNSKTGRPQINVTGNVDETSVVEIRLKGINQPVTMTGNAFSAILVPEYGYNTIEIIATDPAGNHSSEKRTVIFDDRKPSLAVTEPGQDIRTNRDVLILKGTVADTLTAVTLTVTMDGQTFSPTVTNGAFEQRLVMTEEKNYAIVVTASDEVGNSISVQRNVIFDITPPTLTINPVVSPTNQPSITVSGTREEGSTVSIACTGAVAGTIEYPSVTTWSAGLSSLTSGDITITATATDSADNETTAATHFIYDITPPTGAITINSGAGITPSPQVSLALIANDANGVAQMQLSDDNTSWTPPESFNGTRAWSLLPGDGLKQVFVKYSDTAGNWSTAISSTIILDTTPPSVSATPAGGIYGAARNVSITTSEPSVIHYTTDGTTPCVTSAIYSAPLSITITTTLRYLAIDGAGNHSDIHTDTYIIDTIPPLLQVSTLPDGSYTNNEVLNVGGTVSDDQSGIKELKINGITVTVQPDGSFSQAVVLTKGTNTITVIAIDQANNQASDSRTINLDQAAPNLVITAPADNSKTATALTIVRGTVDETSTVTVKLGSNLQTAIMNGANFSADVNLAPGTNTIEVTATDLAGNTSSQKRTVVYDDQKPSLAITLPAQDIRTNQANLTIRGTASDPYTAVTVSIVMDGKTYAPAVVNGQFEQAVSFTCEKSYAILVTATNEVGATTTAQRNVIFDVTPPALTINPVASPTTLPNQIISGTREAGATVSVTCAGAVVGIIEYPASATWSVQLSNLVSGDNTIIATSIDNAGNPATASAKITYSPIVPDYTFTFAVFGNKSVTLSGGCYTDSYIGTPASRYYGKYKHGDVGTNSLQPCGIQLTGGVAIFGKALVGAGGNPAKGVCINGGSSVYNNAIGTLSSTKDMKPRTDPGGGIAMGALKLTSDKKMTLPAGNYRFTKMDLSGNSKLTLNGNVILHIDGDLRITGSADIKITSGSVVIYANGKKVDISGGSFVNTSLDSRNLILYGTSGVQTINLTGGTSLYGLVYAPTADIKVSGGQNTYGSLIGNTVDLSGGVSVHYDESLVNGLLLN